MSMTRCAWLTAALVCLAPQAQAFEDEPAVPLFIDAVLGKVSVDTVVLTLSGREVEIVTTLHNREAQPHKAGFYARTPFFRQLGIAETHSDKTFSDLSVSSAGRTVRGPGVQRRGFFMGQDITAALAVAGIAPLPDLEVSSRKLARVRFPYGIKAEDWEGYVSYSWAETIAPGARSVSTIRYRALPEFGPESVASDRFNQMVRAHCGDPAAVAAEVRKRNGASSHVMLEVYDIPVSFMRMEKVKVSVQQGATNWLKAQPIAALGCGLQAGTAPTALSGEFSSAEGRLSVLVMSRQQDMPAQGGQD